MSVVKVETFDVDVGASGTTHTLTNDVGSLANAFVRRPGPSDKASGGPTGSTGNTGPIDVHIGVEFTGTSTLTWRRGSSTTSKIIGEVWRYTGSPGGADEFIVRGHVAVTVTGSSASQAIAGIGDRNRCVPFITGVDTSVTSTSDYEQTTFSAYIDASDNVVVTRNNSGGTCTVYIDVVEFTGSNWRVGHGVSSNHDSSAETVTLNTDSTGSGGSTFSVNWATAFIEATMGGDSSETGLSDVLCVVIPDTSTSVTFSSVYGSGGARNDADGHVHVVENANMGVYREEIVSISEGNGTYGTVGFPTGAPTDRAIDELALEWMVDTSGTGTAHARGRLNARITAASGTVQHWVHRSGLDVDVAYGVIDLTNVDGVSRPVITNVDDQIDLGETDIVVTGSAFGASQGTGKVELAENADYTGTIVEQTVDSWSDTSIEFDSVQGGLPEGTVYVFVTDDAGTRNAVGYPTNLGEQDYASAMVATGPDHLWMFDGDYVDTGTRSNRPADNAQVGNPSFGAPICRNNTNALALDGNDSTSPANSTAMNDGAQTRRVMGGWFLIEGVQQGLAAIYEEGAQVNNYCMIIGLGNRVLCQAVDDGGYNIQVYGDKPLAPNRPYHLCWEFSGNGYQNVHRFYVDGVAQARSFGNPPDLPVFPSHTGNIEFGGVGTTLEVGGTDIVFDYIENGRYAAWATYEEAAVIDGTTIRETLFESGCLPDKTISGTQAQMQTAFEVHDGTTHPNWPLTYKVAVPPDEANPTFVLTDQVFDEDTTLHVRWMGPGTLTIVNDGTSNFDPAKVSTPGGGTVLVVNRPRLNLTNVQNPSEVRVYEAGTTNELGGQESVTSGTFSLTIDSVSYPSVDVVVHSLGFQYLRIEGVDMTAGDVGLPIAQRKDRQYRNP